MHLISKSSLKVLLALAALSAVVSSQDFRGVEDNEIDSKQIKNSNKGKPQAKFDIGPYTLELSFNETRLKDKLRLSKSYIKHTVYNRLSPDKKPLFDTKISHREELIRCENLTLSKQDRAQFIDCQPVQNLILDDSYKSLGADERSTGDYVRRSKLKQKSYNSFHHYIQTLHLYPYKNEYTYSNIESSLKDESSFMIPNINLGYYMEWNYAPNKMGVILECAGDLFWSVNRSEIFTRFSDDTYPEFEDEFLYFIQQSYKNGFHLNLKNFTCSSPMAGDLITLRTDFVATWKSTFPYLTLHHTTVTEPHHFLFNYDAVIDQQRDPNSSDLSFYNTTININSTSGYFPMMSFHLNQSFINRGPDEGFEHMKLVGPNHAISVDSAWVKGFFGKWLEVFTPDESLPEKLKRHLYIIFEDFIERDQYELRMIFEKSTAKELFSFLSDLYKDINQAGSFYSRPDYDGNLGNYKDHDEL